MTHIRACRICSGWHDLHEAWPEACYGHFGSRAASGPQIIQDINPYQAMGVDVATGKAPRIGGRRQHREYLKRNGYVEVGNEPIKAAPQYNPGEYRQDVRKTIETMKGQGRWK
jgi:hypothetical protein